MQEKLEAKKKITIVTHNSKFHTDDVFGVATLMLVLEKNHEVNIVRTRDEKIITEADYVVDVGFLYDPEKNRFDHHQEGGAGKRENGIPYASFGLVWKQYGEKISGNKEIADKIDSVLVQGIDAGDNGIQIVSPIFEDIYPYEFGNFIHSLNPSWKEGTDQVDKIFLQAVDYSKLILSRLITRKSDKLEAKKIVEKIYNESLDKRLIVLDRYYPANDFLIQFPEPLFIVFPQEDTTWTLKTIKNNSESFIDRKGLPASWAGKRDFQLEKVTGVAGSIFCHINLFIAIAQTKEAILKLADIALNS